MVLWHEVDADDRRVVVITDDLARIDDDHAECAKLARIAVAALMSAGYEIVPVVQR